MPSTKSSDTRSSKPQASPEIIPTDIERLSENGQRSLTAIAHLHTRAFRDAMKFNAQLLDFARRRIGADIDASDRLCRCESLTDAMGVMTDFYSSALQDYADQTSAMMRSGTEIPASNAAETIAEAQRLNGGH